LTKIIGTHWQVKVKIAQGWHERWTPGKDVGFSTHPTTIPALPPMKSSGGVIEWVAAK
jgi:hypothetical protein